MFLEIAVAWTDFNVNVKFLLCSLQRSTFAQQLAPIQEVKTKLNGVLGDSLLSV